MDIKPVEFKKELADKNVKFIADINVLDGNNNIVKISDTKMKIKIALPDDLKGYNKYEVAYILNGEIKETMPATVENGYIVFETSHLSQYGIIATSTANGAKSPKTGDNSSLALWFTILAISGDAVIGKKTLCQITVQKKQQSSRIQIKKPVAFVHGSVLSKGGGDYPHLWQYRFFLFAVFLSPLISHLPITQTL